LPSVRARACSSTSRASNQPTASASVLMADVVATARAFSMSIESETPWLGLRA